MKYYAEIYVTTNRPTGRLLPENELDIENEITMRSWVKMGEFDSTDKAWEEWEDSTREDEEGFIQWK